MSTDRKPIKINLTPPATVARNAEKGLRLRKEFGRGGTHIGVERARGLSAREPVTPHDIRRISSYFARHAVDKKATSRVWGDEKNPSAGYVAWLLWGGDEGQVWADALKKKLNED